MRRIITFNFVLQSFNDLETGKSRFDVYENVKNGRWFEDIDPSVIASAYDEEKDSYDESLVNEILCNRYDDKLVMLAK